MPTTCIVPLCTSGYKTNSEKVSFFSIPRQEDIRVLWQSAINRENTIIKPHHRVCSKHFAASDIIWEKNLTTEDGQILGVSPYSKPKLRAQAVPTIFEWNQPEIEGQTGINESKNAINESLHASDSSILSSDLLHAKASKEKVDEIPPMQSKELYSAKETEMNPTLTNSPISSQNLARNSNQKCHPRGYSQGGSRKHRIFQERLECSLEMDDNEVDASNGKIEKDNDALSFEEVSKCELPLPAGWSRSNYSYEQSHVIVFAHTVVRNVNGTLGAINSKEVLVDTDLNIHVKVFQQSVDLTNLGIQMRVTSLDMLGDILFLISSLNVCYGCAVSDELKKVESDVMFTDCTQTLRHKNCHLLSRSVQCQWCHTGKRTLVRKNLRYKSQPEPKRMRFTVSPSLKKHIKNKDMKINNSKKKIDRLEKATDKLRAKLQEHQKKVADIEEQTLQKSLEESKLSKNHRTIVWEILRASKRKSPKGNRYGEDWLLLCILLHMRSSGTYKFLRDNNILPLPSVSTIKRNLAMIKVKCGFDPKFFEILQTFLAKKKDEEKHGLILLDEISTRESLAVNSQTLSYVGLVDFGEEGESPPKLTERANHGLVLLFQPLFDTYTQPVAVFASRGPTVGVMLAKLIIKCIILLERAGATIHGFISDGASTNRACWTELGANAKRLRLKNYFTLPGEPNKKRYIFSDTPHLIKNIRNRLYNNESLQLDPEEELIKWEHFNTLYDEDGKLPGKARICSRLKKEHLSLNSSSKMRVRLAVQIFSKSVADGLQFYKNRQTPGLEDCSSTIKFCRWMNSLFDALNNKEEGVKPGDPEFKLLEDSLEMLDDWEKKLKDEKLEETAFLTRETAEGLRMTLKSTIDLITDLTSNGFKTVFTGRINQDALEQFFGTVRGAGGCNDHPSTPTFLQIYRILSLYTILKPPKSGNCTVLEEHTPLITLSELKEIYACDQNNTNIQSLKEKLIAAVKIEDWRIEEILTDHDYTQPQYDPIEFMLYYVTECICQKVLQVTECDICIESIKNLTPSIRNFPADLMELRAKSNFIHPNINIFNLICELENIFVKKISSPKCTPFIYEEVISEVINNTPLSFPCEEHGAGLISSIVRFYVRLRMHKYASQCNQEKIRQNQLKKKISKFTRN